MRTMVFIGTLGLAGFFLLRSTWERDHFYDFVIDVHPDTSADWSVIIPLDTWSEMEREVDQPEFRSSELGRAGLTRMSKELLREIASGFKKRGLSAEGCQVISAGLATQEIVVR